MPRSASLDAMDKFRFVAFVFRGLNFQNPEEELGAKAPPTFIRGGFSEITLPTQNTTEIEYKENHMHNFQYYPGLTRFGTMALRRGATFQNDFYNWARQVHDSADQPSSTLIDKVWDHNRLRKDTLFRRTVIIIDTGRAISGNVAEENAKRAASLILSGGTSITDSIVKAMVPVIISMATQNNFVIDRAWVLNEAWPIRYSGGDGLVAQDDGSKLIESLEIRYESYMEIF